MLIADADIDFSVMPNFEFSVNLLVFDDFSQMSICPSFLRLLVLVIVLVYWYWWFRWFCCWCGCCWCCCWWCCCWCCLIMRMMMGPISRRHPSALWFLLRYLLPMLVARQRHRYKPEGKPMGTTVHWTEGKFADCNASHPYYCVAIYSIAGAISTRFTIVCFSTDSNDSTVKLKW